MNELIRQMRNRPIPRGTALLCWLGQMGLLVRIGGTLVCVDYFATETPDRQVPPPVPTEEMEGIDAFLGTHDHIDHIDHPAWRAWAKTCPGAKFIFPALHMPAVLADGIAPERCIGMNDGGSVRIGDVTVSAIPAAHEFLDRDPASGLYPALQYVIRGEGVSVYHAGDTVRYEGMLTKLQAFGPLDAAILPINGRDARRYRENCIGNMTFQESVDLAGELRLRAAVPGHWDMFAGNPGDPGAFEDYMKAKYPEGPAVLRPEAGIPFEIQSPAAEA